MSSIVSGAQVSNNNSRSITTDAYQLSQSAIADLKTAVHLVLSEAPPEGLTNAQIGRMLGIYAGHVGHPGHIPRVLLGIMATEGVVRQNPETKAWRLHLQTAASAKPVRKQG